MRAARARRRQYDHAFCLRPASITAPALSPPQREATRYTIFAEPVNTAAARLACAEQFQRSSRSLRGGRRVAAFDDVAVRFRQAFSIIDDVTFAPRRFSKLAAVLVTLSIPQLHA